MLLMIYFFFFFYQKTAYEMRISDLSSDVCSSDLVELEQVRFAGEFAREQQPRAFTARQRADTGLNDTGIEQELLEVTLDMLFDPAHLDPVAAVGEDVADGLVRRHQAALLVDDDTVERRSENDLALVRLKLAGQQLEQGRLAGAVRADDADAVAALDAEIQPLDDRAVAEALGHALGDDHRLRSDVVIGEAELGDAGAADHRGAGGAHFLQFLEPALVALAARGDPAFEAVRPEPQLRIEALRGARPLGQASSRDRGCEDV